MIDQYDRLQAACDAPCPYPTNLIRTHAFSHILQSYQAKLRDNEKRLFESRSRYHLIELLEAYDGDSAFIPTSCNSIDHLKKHFQLNRKDPKCRHVFIEAESSRSPLDCSKEMVEYLLSFHQVSPSFLEFVFAFGEEKQPEDFHYTSFRQESFLNEADAAAFAIFRLGRSGREIRHCYNLWSAEPSSGGSNPWSIRQTAVYHSFDVDTGRAFWINIKANDVMKSRITDEAMISNRLCAHSMSGLSSCFAATLTTHLIHFEWCRENWRLYLSSLEKRLNKILQRVLNAPVELLEATVPEDTNDLNQHPNSVKAEPTTGPSRASTFGQEPVLSRRTTGTSTIPKSILPSITAKWSGNPRHQIAQGELQHSLQKSPVSPIQEEVDDGQNQFRFLEQFPIEQLQQLSRIASALQEVSLVTKLNTDVLVEITEYYQSLINDAQFPTQIKTGCRTAISDFFQQSRSIIKDLEREQCRITTLIHMLDNGKTMFESILQFRNVEVNKLFALNAHHGSRRMEIMTQEMRQSTIEMERLTKSMHNVAEKTERETASMHIITFVTLIFLPGTFIATFFGSGLFQWDQNNPGAMPVWKPEYFALFAKICFPFMAVIMLIWVCAYWWATRSRANRNPDDEERQLLDGQEYSEKV